MTSGSFLPHDGSPPNYPSSPPTKRDLKSWWKSFKMPKHQDPANASRPTGIFGVPLRQSITYANVAISLVDEDNRSYIYGYVPIVVAKCGVFLKERATGVEGIFRLSGSEKRIKELKTIFDSPDRYGKGLVWEGYTVHDAANVLRRYLNDLPEPVVPLDLYEKFRQPLKGAIMRAPSYNEGSHLLQNVDPNHVITSYQHLITELPPLNRQLLLYLLDLLAVFAAKADENRMNSQNLAAIFQPGMLSHPDHDMLPEEYRLNQSVIIFLIENQDHFLIGMQGTEADEQTVQAVQHGVPQRVELVGGAPSMHTSPSLARSSSNASAGAESVRRDGKLRRNRSVSSRHSRQGSGVRTPRTPTIITAPSSGGGLGRSNTVPSKRSPGIANTRHARDMPREGSTPLGVISDGMVYSDNTANPPSRSKTLRVKGHAIPSPIPVDNASTSSLSPSPLSYGESFRDGRREPTMIVKQRPTTSSADSSERRQLNKLRKKRIPDSANPSAQSSSTSLSQTVSVSTAHETMNALDSTGADPTSQFTARPRQPDSAINASPVVPTANESWSNPVPPPTRQVLHVPSEEHVLVRPARPVEAQADCPPRPTLLTQAALSIPPARPTESTLSVQSAQPLTSTPQPTAQSAVLPPASPLLNVQPRQTRTRASSLISAASDSLLKSKKSPPTSLHSSFNEGSDIDQIDELSRSGALNPGPASSDEADREKKRRWRLSRPRKEDMQGFIAPITSRIAMGLNNADSNSTSVGGGQIRGQEGVVNDSSDGDQHSGNEEQRPIDWIKNKYRDVREIVDQKIADQRRPKSPPPPIETMFAFNASFTAVSQTRGRSIDLPRHDASVESPIDQAAISQEHSPIQMSPQTQVQAEPSPALPPRPRNSEDSTKPMLQPQKPQDEYWAPMLPPRRSQDDHKIPVRARKPVPGQVSGSSANSVPHSPSIASISEVNPSVVPETLTQRAIVSSANSPGFSTEPAPAPIMTLVAAAVPALEEVSPVDENEDDDVLDFPVAVSPIADDEEIVPTKDAQQPVNGEHVPLVPATQTASYETKLTN
ncbi:hypothetical protein BROUX41_004077 [Berkeleyomyces rouxiae]|uniref:uncharacterized protein n=1 Tax=Berkeleyomyces rouxiae TaxID=2035830 RepID=UPI003B7A39BE